MSVLKKIPWLALGLLLITYAAFGWIVSQSLSPWSDWLIEEGKNWGWLLDEKTAWEIIYVLEIGLIFVISIALTIPLTLLTLFFGSWLKSDTTTFISLLGWAFVLVIILAWLEHFLRFIVLLTAALLARLELQNLSYNKWQMFFLLTLISLSGFGLGILMFKFWSHAHL